MKAKTGRDAFRCVVTKCTSGSLTWSVGGFFASLARTHRLPPIQIMRRMFPGQRAHQGSTWQPYRYIRSFAQRSYGKQGLPIAAFPSFVPYLCFVVMYRTDRIILIFFISACAVFVVLHNFLTCPSPAIKKMVEGVEVLDTMCSKMASDCYIVKQSVYKNFQINRFVVSQKHSHGGRYTISKTPMKINSQGKLTFNRSTIAFECLIVGAVAPFALNPSLFDKKGYVLSIGLGGASYDMFFYSNFPKLDVTVVELDPTIATMAKKWFGAVESDRRRTVVTDGVKFLEKAARETPKYDIIALDACQNSDEEFNCPAKPFYDLKVFPNIYNALSDNGTVVVNVLASNTSIIQEIGKKYFPTCFISEMSTLNRVLTCSKQILRNTSRDAVLESFRGAAKKLGLDQRIKSVTFEMI